MADSSEPILGLALRCDRHASRLARQALAEVLDEGAVAEDACLVTSELVNQAILCAEYSTDAILRVAVGLDDGYLVISVHHPGDARVSPAATAAQVDPEAGALAQRVLEHVADRWGTELPDGRQVWAALPLRAAKLTSDRERPYASEC